MNLCYLKKVTLALQQLEHKLVMLYHLFLSLCENSTKGRDLIWRPHLGTSSDFVRKDLKRESVLCEKESGGQPSILSPLCFVWVLWLSMVRGRSQTIEQTTSSAQTLRIKVDCWEWDCSTLYFLVSVIHLKFLKQEINMALQP